MTKKDDDFRRPTVVMPATRMLQSKVGRGKIAPQKVKSAEDILGRVRGNIDTTPFAEEHLQEIKELLETMNSGPEDGGPEVVERIARSIMKFKGNVGMFSADNCVDLAVIVLRWVESVEEIDKDVKDILNGYYVTLDQIFSEKLKDEKQVAAVIKEMNNACERYFLKHPELQLTAEIGNQNAFYVERGESDRYKVSSDLDKEFSDDELIGEDD